MFRSKRKFIARSVSKNTFAGLIISRIESKIIGRIISKITIISQSTNKKTIASYTRNINVFVNMEINKWLRKKS